MNENRSTGRTLTSVRAAWSVAERYGDDVTRVTLDAWSTLSRTCEIWWTRSSGTAAILARSNERARDLIRHARRRSPFYRKAWHAIPAGNAKLSALPPVTKGELMSR